ncbi:hypothetical protein [Clostridium niameyense]|uniref:hypothetical protein n=1 Tax=Clostridium niameyense TaxID=1622073 RepID=UPI00067F4A46|nr:hypothetical protein [Clostridium niameyense]
MITLIIILFIILTIKKEKITRKQLEEKYGLGEKAGLITIVDTEFGSVCVNSNGQDGQVSYVWKDENNIYFIADEIGGNDYGKITIPIDRIMYFTRIGDMYTNIRGGGTDLAIIRSAIEGEKDRDRIKEIKTEVIDKRTTIIKLLDDNGNKKIIKFKSSDYDVFLG